MGNVLDWSAITGIIGALVVVVNILTEVIKKATWDKIPTNLLVIIISLALTLAAFFAYCSISSVHIVWYMVIAAVVVAFLVAYAAMFGFDKLKEMISQLGKK